MSKRQALVEQLIRHEGLCLFPYVDTVGKWTIGVGRNLTDRGISRATADQMLNEDIDLAIKDLVGKYPWFPGLDPVRQSVLVNMTFNLGLTRLGAFTQTLGAIERGDYFRASELMLLSTWAAQVGSRATRLSRQMRSGEWA